MTTPITTPMHQRERAPNYDRAPAVPFDGDIVAGWAAIADAVRARAPRVIALETSPGVDDATIAALVTALGSPRVIQAADCYRAHHEIDAMLAPILTDDPVFGKLSLLRIEDFLDPVRTANVRNTIDLDGVTLIAGLGASLIAQPDLIIWADMPRWEAQMRMRRGGYRNLGACDAPERWQESYKRAYFVDWRVADRLKRDTFARMDLVLDTTIADEPKLVQASAMLAALARAATRPFRVVPYFDPAPWGGQWMKTVCDLDRDAANYGWCFDCVPEENSLLLDNGTDRIEIPSTNLVFTQPRALLGEAVYGRFGDEFPIRFDFLDTIEGGILSLQVHPMTEYIQHTFGMHYTQDESYYILDAEPEGEVLLGVREGIDEAEMLRELRKAEDGSYRFPDERFINRFPAKRHDHFLIPAGTIHSSTRAMVLEISATPYIFTFKLWDWDRPGLDGRPRPVHVDHGERVIRWERDTEYARARLINRVWETARGEGWREEHTGLHEQEFIETRRHWFTTAAPHPDRGSVRVLNLIQGEEAIVESVDGSFEPYVVHYAETFIVPAAAGAFTVRPYGISEGTECATIEAYVRTEPAG